MQIPKKADKVIGKVVNLVTSSVSQTSTKRNKTKYPEIEGMKEACRKAAADSFVLLKNDGGVLPLLEDETVAFFGRVQYDTFFVGYGSGGDVNAHYTVSINKGIKNCGRIRWNEALDETYRLWVKKNPVDNGYWGHWPMGYDEMHVNEAIVKRAAFESAKAVVFLGRAAGEDRENTLEKGSYYLTDEEENMLRLVRKYFVRVAVVLNVGNIIDLSWVETLSIPAVGICWQGGMETGNAVADILCGKVSPSGHLTDTIARKYEDYPSSDNFGNKEKNHYEEDIFVGYRYFETFAPETVLFPFGHGISYTTFSAEALRAREEDGRFLLSGEVMNTGGVPGSQVVQIYVGAADTVLPVPAKTLVGFRKTKVLAPGEREAFEIPVTPYDLAVFDDSGKTGHKNAWLLQKGGYTFHVGFSVRDTQAVPGFVKTEHTVLAQVSQVGAPKPGERMMRLTPLVAKNGVHKAYEPSPVNETDLRADILKNLPATVTGNGDPTSTLYDVKAGQITLDDFVSSLSLEELEALTRGDYVMNSPLGATGNAGVFGGVLESLRARGVLPVTTTDGPSGIRLAASSSLLPNGTALASTFDPALVTSLYEKLGQEMKDRGSDVLLAPGMNIHRNPLCGRNFEYFSEDPLVTGKSAAAVVTGLQNAGVSGCPKHFALNNQEVNRTKNNSVVSARALREIYLKGFEICVKEASPKVLMTSYNKINGVWGHYNYELVTKILRGEWGYQGLVITDWWMQKSSSPEFPALRDQAYRVRAGVDVLMPGGERIGKKVPDGTLLETLGQEDGITLGEMQATAKRVLTFILNSEAFTKPWEAKKMKVMSFNILCAGSGEKEWKKRIPLVVRAIRNTEPDLFGVQEAHFHWMKALTDAFPDYAYVGVGRDDGKKKGEFSAIFFRKEQFSVLDSGNFWLSETPEKPGKGWDAACVRICSWAKLKEKGTDREFVFMNTHLDHVGTLAMQNGAELIGQRGSELAGDLPVIVTGDFNVTPESAPCKAIKDCGFVDCRDVAAETDTGTTYHGYLPDGDPQQAVIDYVFVKGDVFVRRLRVVRKQIDGLYPSDHHPVVADLEF